MANPDYNDNEHKLLVGSQDKIYALVIEQYCFHSFRLDFLSYQVRLRLL